MQQEEQQQSGFSLIELIVVLGVVAIALGIGAPAFATLFANNRMTAAVNDLMTSLHAAHSEAIKRQVTVTLCSTADGNGGCTNGGSLADGWTVFVDRNSDAIISDDDVVLQRHPALPVELRAGLSVGPATALNYIAFAGTGTLGTPMLTNSIRDVQLCDGRGDVDTGGGIAAGRWVQLHPTGWPELHRDRVSIQGDRAPLGGC